jgi:hypothetical protein
LVFFGFACLVALELSCGAGLIYFPVAQFKYPSIIRVIGSWPLFVWVLHPIAWRSLPTLLQARVSLENDPGGWTWQLGKHLPGIAIGRKILSHHVSLKVCNFFYHRLRLTIRPHPNQGLAASRYNPWPRNLRPAWKHTPRLGDGGSPWSWPVWGTRAFRELRGRWVNESLSKLVGSLMHAKNLRLINQLQKNGDWSTIAWWPLPSPHGAQTWPNS